MTTSVPLSPGIRYPQDFSIRNLTLLSAVGTVDLKMVMTELSYQEDLFNNTSSGYLMITESMNYVESLNLNGNEFLRMTFSKSGDPSTEIDKLMRVYKQDKRKLEGNLYTVSYCLYFCSEEMILNEQYKISKAYPGKAVFENVVDILLNELNVPASKLANIEPTYGAYDFVLPTIKPFDAINWMSVYARPTAGTVGSDMIFYEDKYGFNFRSLQSLMSSDTYCSYTYNPKNTNPSDLNEAVYSVLTYEILSSYDILNGINSGAFANQLISADILTRRRTVTNFDYAGYQKDPSSVQLNPFPLANQYQNRFGDELNQSSQAVLKLVFSNYNEATTPYIQQSEGSVAHNIFAETYIPYRTAQLALANYTRIKISVPGDSNITVGAVVNFSLGSINPNVTDPDAFYSGNYLVTAVRHLISNRYITVLEIAKDSVPTQYASPDNNSTIWTNTSEGVMNG